MTKNTKKWTALLIVTVLLTFTGSIGIFSAAKGSDVRCNKVIIEIENPEGKPFILEEDIRAMLNEDRNETLEGKFIDDIDITGLERKIKRNLQIRNCEIHADLKGNLIVEIEPYLPMARILVDNAADVYVTQDGVFFPTSKSYTARTLLLSGSYFAGLSNLKDKKNDSLMVFLHKITEDEFWKTQFSEVEVSQDFHIKIVPLLGEHIIEIGTPEDIDAKLERLLVFYKKIFPVEGWDTFTRVNVAYANQVVCE